MSLVLVRVCVQCDMLFDKRYKLAPEDERNDLKRLQQNVNKYRLVSSFTASSQVISAQPVALTS